MLVGGANPMSLILFALAGNHILLTSTTNATQFVGMQTNTDKFVQILTNIDEYRPIQTPMNNRTKPDAVGGLALSARREANAL